MVERVTAFCDMQPELPLARVITILRYTDQLKAAGASVDRLLCRAGIPAVLLATSLDGLGPYGHVLKGCVTLYDYLRKGISLYNMLITGQRLWLSHHGSERTSLTWKSWPSL